MNFAKKGSNAREAKPLPLGFRPGVNDVLCGRGSECMGHMGNKRFRLLVESFIEIYAKTTTKFEKSSIIAEIVDIVRRQSPNGGFVKKDLLTGQYFEIGDFYAVSDIRHKLSSMVDSFRDIKHLTNSCFLLLIAREDVTDNP